ncbi:MAG: hypothetical protein ABMA14_11435 [Hyphomonadaceae bacterium]
MAVTSDLKAARVRHATAQAASNRILNRTSPVVTNKAAFDRRRE